MQAGTKNIFSSFYNPSTLYSNYKTQSEYQNSYYLTKISTTERMLVLSSIRMILGYSNQIYKYNQEEGFHLSDILNTNHLTPRVLNNVTVILIQYSNRLMFVKNKVKLLRKYSSVILHELIDGVQQFLKQVTRYFTELNVVAEFQAGKINRKDVLSDIAIPSMIADPFTLIKLNSIVEEKMEALSIATGILTKILQKFKSSNNHSLIVLNTLWETFDKFESFQLDAPTSQLLLKLSIQPMKRYLQIVQSWFSDTMKSQIETKQQFFIKRIDEQYCMIQEQIPQMLKQVAEQIFSHGKFIKIIYSFANEQFIMSISQFMNLKQQFKALFDLFDSFALEKQTKPPIKPKQKRFHSISSMLKSQKQQVAMIEQQPVQLPYNLHVSIKNIFQINYSPVPILDIQQPIQNLAFNKTNLFLSEFKLRYVIYLNKILESIKGKCSEYFNFKEKIQPFHIIPEHIYYHLTCIRSYILFEKGDFVTDLVQILGEELDKPTSIIQENLISDLVETTLLNYNPVYNPNPNSNSKLTGNELIKNIKFRFLQQKSNYSGWDMFYLQYKLSPPFHYLFPVDLMSRYNIIFNFIWRLKHIQYLLKQISYDNKGNHHTKTYYLFRNSLNLFSSNLLADVLLRIRDQFEKFMELLISVQSLEEFIDLHRKFVSALQVITFINSKQRHIHLRLQSITQIIMKVRQLINEEHIDERDKRREIQKLSEEFKMRAKDLLYTNQSFTLEVLDFTGFYQQ